MSITWGELDKFQLTWDELDTLGLSWDEWDNITSEKLLEIARNKLERFNVTPALSQKQFEKVMPIIKSIVVDVAANLTAEALKSVEWNNLLKQVVAFLGYVLRQNN